MKVDNGSKGGSRSGSNAGNADGCAPSTSGRRSTRCEKGLLDLPSELMRRTVSFLTLGDVSNLSRTCPYLHCSLFMTNRIAFTRLRWTDEDVCKHRSIRLRVSDLHGRSVALSFWWHDQGWGNLKGQVYIVGTSTASTPSNKIRHHWTRATSVFEFRPDIHRVVCTSPVSSHHMERISMTFVPVEGEVYHLWYKLGGGARHSLHLSAGILHTVIFDDEDTNLAKTFQTLHNAKALTSISVSSPPSPPSFCPRMLRRYSRLLRKRIAAAPSPNEGLLSFMKEFDIPITKESLLTVVEIIQSNLQEQKEQLYT